MYSNENQSWNLPYQASFSSNGCSYSIPSQNSPLYSSQVSKSVSNNTGQNGSFCSSQNGSNSNNNLVPYSQENVNKFWLDDDDEEDNLLGHQGLSVPPPSSSDGSVHAIDGSLSTSLVTKGSRKRRGKGAHSVPVDDLSNSGQTRGELLAKELKDIVSTNKSTTETLLQNQVASLLQSQASLIATQASQTKRMDDQSRQIQALATQVKRLTQVISKGVSSLDLKRGREEEDVDSQEDEYNDDSKGRKKRKKRSILSPKVQPKILSIHEQLRLAKQHNMIPFISTMFLTGIQLRLVKFYKDSNVGMTYVSLNYNAIVHVFKTAIMTQRPIQFSLRPTTQKTKRFIKEGETMDDWRHRIKLFFGVDEKDKKHEKEILISYQTLIGLIDPVLRLDEYKQYHESSKTILSNTELDKDGKTNWSNINKLTKDKVTTRLSRSHNNHLTLSLGKICHWISNHGQ
jgi:hypothetical protein